jgi:hypothetical protein
MCGVSGASTEHESVDQECRVLMMTGGRLGLRLLGQSWLGMQKWYWCFTVVRWARERVYI